MVGCRVERERINGRLNRKEKVGGGGLGEGKMRWEGREDDVGGEGRE